MSVDDLKRRACAAIDDRSADLIEFAETIEANPELGYKETETTATVVERLTDIGLDVRTEIAVTGAKARAGDGEFVITVLGELDALVNPEHPGADPDTGACHACGHHAQLANVLGTAYALAETGLVDELPGAVEFVAVPAEEYLDLEYRRTLEEEGTIEFFGGKQELIRRGHVDDWDAAMMIHAADDTPEREITSAFSTNGFVGKVVTYEGAESHAGAAPEEGVNALNAATMGLQAIHANRETFPDEDHVRVHPIMTRGGDGVNVVPSESRLESYVRAATVDAITDANRKTTRALKSGAMAVGADVEIEDYPGYMPLETDETIVTAYDANVREQLGADGLTEGHPHLAGSTDMGDITQLVPGIHPWVGGFGGAVHSREFRVVDREMAYVIPAKLTACTIIDLLADEDARAALTAARGTKRSREEYLETIRRMRTTARGEYREDD